MSADKMFEELGYKKEKFYDEIFYYKVTGLGNKVGFEFWLDYKNVCPVLHEGNDDVALEFDMRELQAINKKCQELGWIKEGE